MTNPASSPAENPRLTQSALTRPFILLPLGLFTAVTVGLVASTTVREPYDAPFPHLFFSDTLHMKAWLTTTALLLALSQLLTASRIYGVLHFPPEGRFHNFAHRWLGRTAVLLTLPVAYHCIFLLGFGTYSFRATIHSLLGSFLYGTFVSKVLIVRSNGLRAWVLPVAGGLLFCIFVGLWLTSAFWFFRTLGLGS
jgi:hypothetical protein